MKQQTLKRQIFIISGILIGATILLYVCIIIMMSIFISDDVQVHNESMMKITVDQINESEMVQETLVKVSGNLMSVGIESFFSTVIASKKMSLKGLKDYESDLLNITSEEEALGFKYCFQTKLTKDTVNERIRGPLGMWTNEETYIDNSMQSVINRLHEYYG